MAFCTNCGFQMNEGVTFCGRCGIAQKPIEQPIIKETVDESIVVSEPLVEVPIQPLTSSASVSMDFTSETATVQRTMKEYKVLTQKDKWFSGKFDPARLEEALNSYASQGWRLVSCATADIAGFGTTRQEFVAVLERER